MLKSLLHAPLPIDPAAAISELVQALIPPCWADSFWQSPQKVLPLHPALRFAPGSFAPSPFQGYAAKGHPWPIAALAASMPLNPFHGDCAHPPEGAVGVACRSVQKK